MPDICHQLGLQREIMYSDRCADCDLCGVVWQVLLSNRIRWGISPIYIEIFINATFIISLINFN